MIKPLPPLGKKLLLVGWDSADWKIIRPLIENGELPTLAKLIKNGASGNLATLEPVLSPMLWTSIATGKHAYDHGVHGFTEVDPTTGDVVPVSAATRRCRTLWEILADEGDLRTNVVGWFATHGEQHPNVNVVSNLFAHAPQQAIEDPTDLTQWPAPPRGTYWPESLAEDLNEQRLHPTEIDGELLRLFVPRASEIDQQRDPRLLRLAERLAEAISVNAATTWLMQHKPWDLTAVYFRAIDEICHEFMPFHSPKMEGVKEQDFELYQDVVNSAYRLHDMFLARLIHLAGPDAAVVLVSDHGFHSDHLRPRDTPNVPAGIVVWHRPQGIVVAGGAGFAAGEHIDGARLLDITPTLLRWFGLPRGSDMEGRVLHEAFAIPPPDDEIPTWEKPEDPDGTLSRPRLSNADNRVLLDQFVALGYIDALSSEPTKAAETTRRENNWQLAQALLHGGRAEQALPLLEEVFAAHPERTDYAQRLAHCQLSLGLTNEAEATIEVAIEYFDNPTLVHLIRGRIARQKGLPDEALQHAEAAQQGAPENLSVLELLGQVQLSLRQWDECEQTCRQVLELNPEQPLAWIGIARCQIHRGESEAALESALEAISLNYQSDIGHLNLGLALMQLKRWEEAARSLRNATIINPGRIPTYRLTARTLTQLGRTAEAQETMERAKAMRLTYDFQRDDQRHRLRDDVALRSRERAQLRQEKLAKEPSPPSETGGSSTLELVVVSGLPRSGTSLMMQMLAAGGLEPLTDRERQADGDNPEGYFEWEPIKRLSREPHLIAAAKGKAVKVVAPLLPHLLKQHRYKIIFMRRPIEQVLKSQSTMLSRTGQETRVSMETLAKAQSSLVDLTLQGLHATPQTDVLEINFNDLVADPLTGAQSVFHFLGSSHLANADLAHMAATVRRELHRHRPD